MPNLAKTSRYTLGEKIDTLFLEVIEQIGWEIKSIDVKKYITFSEQLDEIGRQLGGWARQSAQKETPAPRRGRD